MEDNNRARSLIDDYEPDAIRFTTPYLRRLIIEAPNIMEKIYNPGGSIILRGKTTEHVSEYSSTIGSSLHNDLIDAGIILRDKFSKAEREALYTWAYGMTSEQASGYLGIRGSLVRKRRQRAVKKLRNELQDALD